MREEWDLSMEDGSAYKMENVKLEKTLLEVEVVMKDITRSVAGFERILYLPGTKTSKLINSTIELVTCSSQTTESGDRATGKLLSIHWLCT